MRRIIRPVLLTALVLLLPLLAMRFTDEVNWSSFDFAVAGALLLGAGLAYEFVSARGGGRAYRAAVGMAVAVSLLLVWANLAVGIIGSEDNPANRMYFGVVAVAAAGSAAARLRPFGMARAMYATAAAQAIVTVIALSILRTPAAATEAPAGIGKVVAVNLMFVVFFAGSGLLFRHAEAAES